MKQARATANKLAALLLLAGLCHAGPTREERALVAFYTKHYPNAAQPEWLREVARESHKWLARLCLEDQLDTFLSMGHRESGFDPTLIGDDGRSYGAFQMLRENEPNWRAFWKARGYRLGGIDSLDTQAAFAAAEFYTKLRVARGNLWGGVRRYNGAGYRAMWYARNVMVSRKVIFKRPHPAGERVKFCQ